MTEKCPGAKEYKCPYKELCPANSYSSVVSNARAIKSKEDIDYLLDKYPKRKILWLDNSKIYLCSPRILEDSELDGLINKIKDMK
jgi:hypothetical protein